MVLHFCVLIMKNNHDDDTIAGVGTTDSSSDIVLKGVVRVENLEDATEHIADVLARVKPEYLVRNVCQSVVLWA